MEDYSHAQEFFNEVRRINNSEPNMDIVEKRAELYLKANGLYHKKLKKIAILSPGGGVGKTTIATNLALNLRKKTFGKIVILEGDIPNPNLEINLSHLLSSTNKGRLSSILSNQFGGQLDETELGKRNVKGTLMDLIDTNMALTNSSKDGEPKIGAFFSDLRSNLKTGEVYEKLFSIFERVSQYTPKSDSRKRIDYLVCDFCAGSMSDPVITKLMEKFDYRLLVVVPDQKGIRGIENTVWNDENGEFRRENAVNILVLNRVVPGIGETISVLSDTKGRGFNEARAQAEDIKERLRNRFKVDYDVEILRYPSVNQEEHTDHILKPAVVNRYFRNEGFCRSMDELTLIIVNDSLKRAYGGK